MENLFYFGVFIYLVFLVITLMNNERFYQWSEYLAKHNKEELTPATILMVMFCFCMLLLNIVGLLSSQWIVFLFLWIITLFVYPIKKYLFVRLVNNVIEIICVLFILINKFHLHIDLTNLLMQWIKN